MYVQFFRVIFPSVLYMVREKDEEKERWRERESWVGLYTQLLHYLKKMWKESSDWLTNNCCQMTSSNRGEGHFRSAGFFSWILRFFFSPQEGGWMGGWIFKVRHDFIIRLYDISWERVDEFSTDHCGCPAFLQGNFSAYAHFFLFVLGVIEQLGVVERVNLCWMLRYYLFDLQNENWRFFCVSVVRGHSLNRKIARGRSKIL